MGAPQHWAQSRCAENISDLFVVFALPVQTLQGGLSATLALLLRAIKPIAAL